MKTNHTQETILLVDDTPQIVAFLHGLLQSEYQIFFALNGEDALQTATSKHPDLILLDIAMPGMDGFEVCRRLKIQEETKEIPVIFITATREPQDETKGLEMGAVDFITKPINPSVVKVRIKMHLELKRKEEAVKNLGRKNELLLQAAGEGIYGVDLADNITFINPSGAKMLGWTVEALLGQSQQDVLHHARPDGHQDENNTSPMHKISKDGKVCASDDEIFYRKDGTTFRVEYTSTPIWEDKACLGAVIVFRDVTERHHLMNSLNASLKAAEVANQAKSEFLANMSHEIRTPMNAIFGLAKLALQSELTPKLHDYLTKIERSSRSMMNVINDILEFSRIEAGKMQINPIDFNLKEIFDHLSNLFHPQIVEKRIEWVLSVGLETSQLRGDAMRLEQVLTNLVGNAFKFTHNGKIVLEVVEQEKRAKSSQITLAFAVHDTGIGIAPDRLLELFKPFVQADGSITRKYGGTGLGLVISKRIVEMMGGKIWATSQPGQGSVFRFTAKFESRASNQENVSRSSPPEACKKSQIRGTIGGMRILVAEDNPINMQVIRELLEQVGIIVDEACHGKQAWSMVQTTPYDAVLMDLQMPEMDGFTASRLIRSDKRFQNLPIIAVTAHAMEEDKKKCLAAGMNSHIGKPYNFKEVYDTLTQLLSLKLPPPLFSPKETKNALEIFPNVPCLDIETAVTRLAGNTLLYRQLLHRFYENHAQDVGKIAQALEQKEYARAERLAHTVKGVSGQIGAHALQRAAKALEQGIVQKNHKMPAFLNNFSIALTDVTDALAKWDIHPSSTTMAPNAMTEMDPNQVALLLKKWAVMLRDQDSKADSMIQPLRAQLQGHTTEPVLDKLKQKLKRYDYERALELLLEMAKMLGVSLTK